MLGLEQAKMLAATRVAPAVSVWLSRMIMLEADWIYWLFSYRIQMPMHGAHSTITRVLVPLLYCP